MSDLRYLKQNLTHTGEIEAYMLPSVCFELDGLMMAGLTITRLEFGEWHLMEKGQFADDLQDRMFRDSPFFIVFSSNDVEVDDLIRQYRSAERKHQIVLLTYALRLLREGPVGNPLDHIQYIRNGSLNMRNPNRFGRGAYNLRMDNKIMNSDLSVLEGIFNSLALYNRSRHNFPINLALKLFNQSYEPALASHTHQALFLIGCLEALIGTDYHALIELPWSDPDVPTLLARYSDFRDYLAHGVGSSSEQEFTALREIARVLLREALAFELQSPDSCDAVGPTLVERLHSPDKLSPSRLACVSSKYDSLI